MEKKVLVEGFLRAMFLARGSCSRSSTSRYEMCLDTFKMIMQERKEIKDDLKLLNRLLDVCGDWLNVNVGEVLWDAVAGLAPKGSEEEVHPLFKNAVSLHEAATFLYPSGLELSKWNLSVLKVAKALEAIDHLEDYPSRQVLNEHFPKLLLMHLAQIQPNEIKDFCTTTENGYEMKWFRTVFTSDWGNM